MALAAGAILAAGLRAGPAAAESPERPLGCFERVYPAAHLDAHPRQSVRRLIVVVEKDQYGAMGFGVRAFVRGKPQMWLAGGSCAPDGAAWTCRPDTDGASLVRFEAAGTGLKMDNPGRLKIYDDRTGPGLNTRLIGGEAERTFLLAPARNAAKICKPLG